MLSMMMFQQCKPKNDQVTPVVPQKKDALLSAPVTNSEPKPPDAPKMEVAEEAIPNDWNEITGKEGFVVDIKYATSDNFTKKQIYDCGRCFLRPEASEALKMVQAELKENFGFGIKVFDCFRPRPFQQKLWDIVPNPDYVTPPEKGSMHSRGLAIDLTIVDKKGKELNMGTPYDFFGKEAHHDFSGHNADINKNRLLLKSIMEKHGFASIRTEWWHYSYKSKSYPLDEWVWQCN